MATFKLSGFRELQQKLRQLSMKDQRTVLRAAVRAAAKPVLEEARARIPVRAMSEAHVALRKTYKGRLVGPGFAKRSIAAKTWISRDGSVAGVNIGVKREAFYAVNFVELGTSKQAKQPWLRPALDAERNEAVDRFRDTLKKRIDKVTRTK